MTGVARVLAYGDCPGCSRRAVGLVGGGTGHLTWREHTRPPKDGGGICPASNHWLCEAPPAQSPLMKCTKHCRHPLWVPLDPRVTERRFFELVLPR